MRVRFITPEKLPPNRDISPTVRHELENALCRIRTPVWPIIDTFANGGIKRPPFDVPQAWMNHTLHHLLLDMDYNDEVNPFAGIRPITMEVRSVGKKKNQAIDFEKNIQGGNRHVIEVECGNVASIFRSIHKLCMALRESRNTTAILVVPSKELISRCDVFSSMSSSHNAKIVLSEFVYYCEEATMIHIVEFSSDIECNLQNLVDDNNFWRGNWSNEMEEYLRNNINQFLR